MDKPTLNGGESGYRLAGCEYGKCRDMATQTVYGYDSCDRHAPEFDKAKREDATNGQWYRFDNRGSK
jgi:hypothetical protein